MDASTLQRIPSALGFAALAYFAYKASSAILFNLHSSKLQRYHHPSRQDKDSKEVWALVTGASSGIGLEWVHQLAARNFSVVLHGRNLEKINRIITDLKKQYKVNFKPLILDSTAPSGPEFDQTVKSCIQGLNITIVIHNVGGPPTGSVPMMAWQEDITAPEVDGWIDCNARFSTNLTRLLLPTMIQNQPGLMIYISSGATQIAVPKLALYSGAKGYLEHYVKILNEEMYTKKYDIEVKALVTGTVVTATSGRTEKDRSFAMPLTKEFVVSAINKIGWDDAVITPWLGHQVQHSFMHAMPRWLVRIMIGSMLKKTEAGFEKVKKAE